jgi:hypothetical protein
LGAGGAVVEVIEDGWSKHNESRMISMANLLSMHGECRQVLLGVRTLIPRERDAVSLARDLLRTLGQIATPVAGEDQPHVVHISGFVNDNASDEVVKVEVALSAMEQCVVVSGDAGEIGGVALSDVTRVRAGAGMPRSAVPCCGETDGATGEGEQDESQCGDVKGGSEKRDEESSTGEEGGGCGHEGEGGEDQGNGSDDEVTDPATSEIVIPPFDCIGMRDSSHSRVICNSHFLDRVFVDLDVSRAVC